MMKNMKKNRTIRLLSLCLSLVVALGLAAPAAAAGQSTSGYEEIASDDYKMISRWGGQTSHFGSNILDFYILDRYGDYSHSSGGPTDGNLLAVSGILMIDGLEEVRVTCGGVSRTVPASSGREFSLELTLTHSGTAAMEVATRRSGETTFRNVTHGQYLFQRMPDGGYEFLTSDPSVATYDSRGALNSIGINDPEPANQLARPVPASVAAMSAQIVGDETDTYGKMFLLYKWVVDNIAHDTAMESGAAQAVTDSEGVLTLRRSNSAGYANLLRDLLLAQRIPAMTCQTEYLPSGSYATPGVRGVPHSHVEAYMDDGNSFIFGGKRWVFMDPAADSLNTYTGGTLHTEGANGYNTFDLRWGRNMLSLSYKYVDRSGLTHIDNGDGFILGGENFTEVWGYNGPGGEVTIPDGITRISEGAFAGRTDITAVNFPENPLRIEEGAFRGCTGLTELDFPDTIDFIGSYAFAGCTGLEHVHLGQVDSRTTIQTYAFAGCTGLKSIYIPHMYTFAPYVFAGSGIRVLQFADDYSFAMYNTRYSFSDIPYLMAVELPGSGNFDQIEDYAFNEEGRVLEDPLQIYYKGNGEEWDNLVIEIGNEILWEGWWHYNSGIPENMMERFLSEDQPPVEGLSLLPGYPDVSDWAREQVGTAAEKLQLEEVDFLRDTFDYTTDITRSDFAALAVQTYEVLTGEEVPYAPEDAVFADSVGDEAIAKAYDLGIMGGYNSADSRSGVYVGPDDLITREQAATMLARLMATIDDELDRGLMGDVSDVALPFTDTISDWAVENVKVMYDSGIMSGTSGATFSASANYTIEQAIVTIMRIDEWAARGA